MEGNIQEYLDILQIIQKNLLNFLDDENNVEENFQLLKDIFTDKNIFNDKYKLKLILHLIVNLSNNHFRSKSFFSKIERILLLFKEVLKTNFFNTEMCDIFKSNKLLLLFLIEEKMITVDKYFVDTILRHNYIYDFSKYFTPEIKPFITKQIEKTYQYDQITEEIHDIILDEIPEDFNENRKIGENHHQICELIRKDLVKEFIVYINKSNISVQSQIEQSIYETNSFLMDYEMPSLIKYSALYGSIEIFNYLRLNNAIITLSLINYAIHGKNAEIIHFLEDNNQKYNNDSLFYSIQCHQNDIVDYIKLNYLQSDVNIIEPCLSYYNFLLLNEENIDASSFFLLCKYDYYHFVESLLKNKKIDVNEIFEISDQQKTALNVAIEEGNYDIVKLLLSSENIDVNLIYENEVLIFYIF